MVDPLHQTDLGIFTHVRDCIQDMYSLEIRKELDSRLRAVKLHFRFPDLSSCLPEPPYFESCVSIPAFHHRAVFQIIMALSHGRS